MNKDLGIKIVFGLILIISLYLIISGLSENDQESTNNDEIIEEELRVNPSIINLLVDEEEQINAIIIPSDATYQNLYWESANTNIATVDNGVVKGISPGKTIIKVMTEKRKITKIINVSVANKEIPVTEIKVNEPNIEIEVGDTKKIEYQVLPSDATNKKISFYTSDKNIMGFNQDGYIVGVNPGNATVTLKNNNIEAIINVSVKAKAIPVTNVTLNKKTVTIEIGKTDTLTAKITPTNATNTKVAWESSDTNIATVDNGKITAKAVGTATITVKTEDGNKT